MQFEHHIGIDYSGAATAKTRSATIQAYQSQINGEISQVASPAAADNRKRNWNRIEIFHWIMSQFEQARPIIIGIDHGLSFPISYFNRHRLNSWDEFLDDFAIHWPTDHPEATVENFRNQSSRLGTNDKCGSPKTGPPLQRVFFSSMSRARLQNPHTPVYRLSTGFGKRCPTYTFGPTTAGKYRRELPFSLRFTLRSSAIVIQGRREPLINKMPIRFAGGFTKWINRNNCGLSSTLRSIRQQKCVRPKRAGFWVYIDGTLSESPPNTPPQRLSSTSPEQTKDVTAKQIL